MSLLFQYNRMKFAYKRKEMNRDDRNKNLTKKFDSFTAVDSLDLRIETGEFFGLLGPNGAGKTTTISLLSTLLLPTEGEILIDGQTLGRNRPDLKRKISVITQEYSMRQDMNMDEIMEYQAVFISCHEKRSNGKPKSFWISADFFPSVSGL